MDITIKEYLNKYSEKKEVNQKFGLFLKTFIYDKDFKMTEKTYNRILECGSYLVFKTDYDQKNFKLHSANFCGNRFCPFCSYLKSIDYFIVNYNLLYHCVKSGEYNFLFLTLTSVNCEVENLYAEITKYYKAFQRFIKRKAIKTIVKGYIRKLEVTYNKNSNTFHPHYHLILLVNKSYFNSRNYISRDKFLEYWSNSFRDSCISQVDVRRINVNNLLDSALELSKYVSKMNNIYDDSYIFKMYYKGLKNRQILCYGGVLKDYYKMYKNKAFEYYLEEDNIEYFYFLFAKRIGSSYSIFKTHEI